MQKSSLDTCCGVCLQVDNTEPQKWEVGFGNGLVPSDNNQLPETIDFLMRFCGIQMRAILK